jgi:hypothetical protein
MSGAACDVVGRATGRGRTTVGEGVYPQHPPQRHRARGSLRAEET